MRRRKPHGFTLIEMIVATLLLAIGVVGALGAFEASTRATGQANNLQTAALLAQQRLTELELDSQNLSGGDQQGEFGDEYPGFRWQQSIETTEYENLFKVTLTITWGTPNVPHTRTFTTYLRKEDPNQQQNSPQPSSSTSGGGTGGG